MSDQAKLDITPTKKTSLAESRTVESVHRSTTFHWVGNGFHVSTYFPSAKLPAERVSPFVLMDYGPPKEFTPLARGKRGVGWHPHRGFETVTLAWEGAVAHRDNAGHAGVIGPGDVQWMTAGVGHLPRGVPRGGVHPPRRPHAHDAALGEPAAQGQERAARLPADHAPRRSRASRSPDGAARCASSPASYEGARGPARTFTPITMLDVSLAPGGTPARRAARAATTRWRSSRRGASRGRRRRRGAGELLLFANDGERLELDRGRGGRHVILLAGEPIDEPIVQYGPFVMNSFDENPAGDPGRRAGRLRPRPGVTVGQVASGRLRRCSFNCSTKAGTSASAMVRGGSFGSAGW